MIITLGKLITLSGILLSFIIACQYAYMGSMKEIILTGIIGLINLYVFQIFTKHENL